MVSSLPYRQTRCQHEDAVSVMPILITPGGFLSGSGSSACGMLGSWSPPPAGCMTVSDPYISVIMPSPVMACECGDCRTFNIGN